MVVDRKKEVTIYILSILLEHSDKLVSLFVPCEKAVLIK